MIRLKDVEMEYENGTAAIRGISLEIQDGEFVFLVGPSGSGKSTLIKLLTGEVVPSSGRIMVNGFAVSSITPRILPLMRRTLGIIFQDFRLIPKKTVYDNLDFVMRAVGAPNKEIRPRILDPERSLELMDLLVRINALGTTVVVVTHEKELVNRFGKRVVTLEKGRVIRDQVGGYVGGRIHE